MGLFSYSDHTALLKSIDSKQFDLAIIGGGITGAGIALDASLRGLSVLLVEKEDFAWGTSSRSTKLIHGGLRYLKQFEFGLVREVGLERAVVYNNARHLVRPESMLLPIYQHGNLKKWSASLALFVYDFLADVPPSERRRMLNLKQTLFEEPNLKAEKLKGGALYYEYRTDDSRLTMSILKSAVDEGATCLNYTEFSDFIYSEDGLVTGISCNYKPENKKLTFSAKTVVNAAGPWVDTVRKADNSLKNKRLQLTKGVHIVFYKPEIKIKHSLYFDSPDGRMTFLIPRGDKIYAGTTDTVYGESIDHPRTELSDIDYILDSINSTLPSLHLTRDDVESTWVGLRPLIHEDGKSPSELSRKDEIFESDSGLISIAGGKLTGYRKMAERVTNIVAERHNVQDRPCKTENYKLAGGSFPTEEALAEYRETKVKQAEHFGIEKKIVENWVFRYGIGTDDIMDICDQFSNGQMGQYSISLFSEIKYTIDFESVRTLSDFFIRRTGLVYFDIAYLKEVLDEASEIFRLLLPLEDIDQQVLDLKEEIKAVSSFPAQD